MKKKKLILAIAIDTSDRIFGIGETKEKAIAAIKKFNKGMARPYSDELMVEFNTYEIPMNGACGEWC